MNVGEELPQDKRHAKYFRKGLYLYEAGVSAHHAGSCLAGKKRIKKNIYQRMRVVASDRRHCRHGREKRKKHMVLLYILYPFFHAVRDGQTQFKINKYLWTICISVLMISCVASREELHHHGMLWCTEKGRDRAARLMTVWRGYEKKV